MLDSMHVLMTSFLSGTFDFLASMDLLDFFSNTSRFITSTTGKIKGLLLGVGGLCVVIAGCMMLFGGGMSQKAKGWLGWIIVGCLVGWGAAEIVSTLRSVSGF
ncbi:TrbC/VirB2 family protein [Brochothrix thermosphacta]|uniref:TrbC/VirB2 family protein n=1 Tax=Brochothrix thermosphacta TaxID=2756 RepID=UPI0009C1105B|nr:TrbC/VirB2 family protein [Brochothrix thermosphacta]